MIDPHSFRIEIISVDDSLFQSVRVVEHKLHHRMRYSVKLGCGCPPTSPWTNGRVGPMRNEWMKCEKHPRYKGPHQKWCRHRGFHPSHSHKKETGDASDRERCDLQRMSALVVSLWGHWRNGRGETRLTKDMVTFGCSQQACHTEADKRIKRKIASNPP